MKRFTQPVWLTIAAILLTFAMTPTSALAEIVGFGDFSEWNVNQGDTGAAPTISPGSIQLTSTGGVSQNRSLFHLDKQDISRFSASFTYQTNANQASQGAAFVLQNDTDGANAVGLNASRLGYSGINNSAAVSIELAAPTAQSGFYSNGVIGGGSGAISPVDPYLGNPINVTLTYDGAILRTSFFDTVTSASFTSSTITNLSDLVGGTTAFVGLTASTNTSQGANQFFSDFRFTNTVVPEPSTGILLVAGCLGLACLRRSKWRLMK